MTFSFFNKKTKILFYGSRGWIGSLFLDYLATVKKIKIDLPKPTDFINSL